MIDIKKGLWLFVIFTGLCLSSNFAKADGTINWERYSSGVFKMADEAHLPVMIFAMSDSCRWCEKMITTTFADAAVIKLINKHFYPVILNVENNPPIAKKYKLKGIPAIIFFNASGKMINIIPGYIQPENLARNLTAIVGDH